MDRRSFFTKLRDTVMVLAPGAIFVGGNHIGMTKGQTVAISHVLLSDVPIFGHTPHGGKMVVSRDGKKVSPVVSIDSGDGCPCEQIKHLKNDGDFCVLDREKLYPGKSHPQYPYYLAAKEEKSEDTIETLADGRYCSSFFVFCEDRVWNIDIVVDTYAITNYQCFCREHDRQVCG